MKELIFDVMLNGRFVCTLKYRFCPLFPITEEELAKFVEEKRPSLKGKNYKDGKAFFDLVSQMRTMQKEYFKTRSKSSLEQSKTLEKRVDAEIERVNKILEERTNPKLF